MQSIHMNEYSYRSTRLIQRKIDWFDMGKEDKIKRTITPRTISFQPLFNHIYFSNSLKIYKSNTVQQFCECSNIYFYEHRVVIATIGVG